MADSQTELWLIRRTVAVILLAVARLLLEVAEGPLFTAIAFLAMALGAVILLYDEITAVLNRWSANTEVST